jgi:predicted molibdopterin-dependent oxidoreductase YjgC
MVSSPSKVLYAIGEVPVKKRPDTGFLIVQNSHMTELATQADIILPSAAGLESEGTIIDYLGRLKEVRKTVEPAGDSKANSDIIIAIAEAMGTSVKKPKDTEIRKALKVKVKAVFTPFKRDRNLDIDAEKFTEDINWSTINGSRLLWLKEVEKGVTA